MSNDSVMGSAAVAGSKEEARQFYAAVNTQIDLTALLAKLEQIRDLEPPMSIICLNQMIEEVANRRTTLLDIARAGQE